MPKLETGGEEILFRLDWDLNVNDHSIDSPGICRDVRSHGASARHYVYVLDFFPKIDEILSSHVDAGEDICIYMYFIFELVPNVW